MIRTEVGFMRHLPFFVIALFLAAGASALTAPWYTLRNELRYTIGVSPCVSVGQVNDDGGGAYSIDVRACSADVAGALGVVLKRDWQWGNIHEHIRVLDPAGAETGTYLSPGADPVATVAQLLRTAFAGNRMFRAVRVSPAPFGSPEIWAETAKEVVQFFNDDLSDFYQNKNEIAEAGFRHVCHSTYLDGTVHVGWTTSRHSGGH
jgi:hypothetical protein